MGFGDSIDIDIDSGDLTLEQIDKLAVNAAKSLKKEQKELAKTQKTIDKSKEFELDSPLFKKKLPAGKGPAQDITKQKKTLDDLIDARIKKTVDPKIKTVNDELKSKLGTKGAKNTFSFLQNPQSFAKNVFQSIPFVGGFIAAADFAKQILDTMVRFDSFFKKLINDRIDLRFNQLRTRQESVDINIGEIQLILSTDAGIPTPREPYNSFVQFNKNEISNEEAVARNDTSGVW